MTIPQHFRLPRRPPSAIWFYSAQAADVPTGGVVAESTERTMESDPLGRMAGATPLGWV